MSRCRICPNYVARSYDSVQELHLVFLPVLQPFLFANLVLGRDVVAVVDRGAEDDVAGDILVDTLHPLFDELGSVRGLDLPRAVRCAPPVRAIPGQACTFDYGARITVLRARNVRFVWAQNCSIGLKSGEPRTCRYRWAYWRGSTDALPPLHFALDPSPVPHIFEGTYTSHRMPPPPLFSFENDWCRPRRKQSSHTPIAR